MIKLLKLMSKNHKRRLYKKLNYYRQQKKRIVKWLIYSKIKQNFSDKTVIIFKDRRIKMVNVTGTFY